MTNYDPKRLEQAKSLLTTLPHDEDSNIQRWNVNYHDLIMIASRITWPNERMVSFCESRDGDYQGDASLILWSNTGKYYYASWGWGSCSGCDALEGCNDLEDYAELVLDLAHNIVPIPDNDVTRYLLNEMKNCHHEAPKKLIDEFAIMQKILNAL